MSGSLCGLKGRGMLTPRSNGRETREGFLNGLNRHRQKRLKDISRLWQYRNGGKPQD